MPIDSFELTRLDTKTFEHLANALALRVLGNGNTIFGPGPDGGRDGFFEGVAPYPSPVDQWKGRWYIQSKFHAPNLSSDHHAWLVDQVKEEMKAFANSRGQRRWPDNWILVTNIDPSGVPETGAYDKCVSLVASARPELKARFHIWGGKKVLEFVSAHLDVQKSYFDLISPARVLSELHDHLATQSADAQSIIHHLIVRRFGDQQYTKLEQAGSSADNRPSIQSLFVDIPIGGGGGLMAANTLASALAEDHKGTVITPSDELNRWKKRPVRARTWFLKGGPGQGKSTLTQYICQINRAALLLADNGPNATFQQKSQARDVKSKAEGAGLWPNSARIPVSLELKDFAQWYGKRAPEQSKRLISYLSETMTIAIGEDVQIGRFKVMLSAARWLFVFDGLDEVPGGIKNELARELIDFIDHFLISIGCDAAVICTSRPQGYSGQLAEMEAAEVDLIPLSPDQALACATPLLRLDRSEQESQQYIEILRSALATAPVAEIMTTPLQAHIMSVIVRDGGKPPERKWTLFNNFYLTIKRREANKNFPDEKVAKLLREGDKLLKLLHNRLGFELHRLAETAEGASTSMPRTALRDIVREIVTQLQDDDIEQTIETLMEATTERLVLVNTPESKDFVRFDVRPLQEFFAAEHIHDSATNSNFPERLRSIVGDSHWREVVHFLVSALVEENRRGELAQAISELTAIDEEDDITRAFARRLARGGLIVSRVFAEGVVEADKRVRQQFLPCTNALLASFSAENALMDISPPHTFKWLMAVIRHTLTEAAESESIGAACAAASYDIDPSSDVCSLVRLKSLGYKVAVIRSAYLKFDMMGLRPPLWIVLLAADVLLSSSWKDIQVDALYEIYQTIGLWEERRGVFETIGLRESAEFLTSCFDSSLSNQSFESVSPTTTVNDGPLIVSILPSRFLRNPSELSSEILHELDKAGGLYAVVADTCRFIKSPDKMTLTRISSYLPYQDGRRMLPEGLSSFFKDDLDHVDGEDAASILEEDAGGCLRQYSLGSEKIEAKHARLLAAKAPSWLLHHILSGSLQNETENMEGEDFIASLVRGLVCENRLTLWFGHIGQALKSNPKLGEQLRRTAVEISPIAPGEIWERGNADTFVLQLPDESALLPSVLAFSLNQGHLATSSSLNKSGEARIAKLQAVLRAFIPDLTVMGNMADFGDGSESSLAALSIHIIAAFPQGLTSLLQDAIFVDGYHGIGGHLYMSAVAFMCCVCDAEERASLQILLSALLEKGPNDYAARRSIERYMYSLREVSAAPLAKSFDASLWK